MNLAMSASKDLFLRMSEAEYMQVPEEIREVHLRSKVYSESAQDFSMLMEDKVYRDLHKTYKETKAAMEERAYQIRENNRKNK